jgi:hypothetical protein
MASGMPAALLEATPEGRARSLRYLDHVLRHQNTLYDATVPAALYVAVILPDPQTATTDSRFATTLQQSTSRRFAHSCSTRPTCTRTPPTYVFVKPPSRPACRSWTTYDSATTAPPWPHSCAMFWAPAHVGGTANERTDPSR